MHSGVGAPAWADDLEDLVGDLPGADAEGLKDGHPGAVPVRAHRQQQVLCPHEPRLQRLRRGGAGSVEK